MNDFTLRQMLARIKNTQKIELVIHDGDVKHVMYIDADCEALKVSLNSRMIDGAVTEINTWGDVLNITMYIPKTPWLEDEEEDEENEHE